MKLSGFWLTWNRERQVSEYKLRISLKKYNFYFEVSLGFSGLCRTPDSFTITQWLVRERLQLGISQQQQKKLRGTALTKAITRLSVQDVVLQLHHPSPTLFLWERRFPGLLTGLSDRARRWHHVTGYDTKLGTLHYFFTLFFSLSVKIQAHPVFWVSRSAVSF